MAKSSRPQPSRGAPVTALARRALGVALEGGGEMNRLRTEREARACLGKIGSTGRPLVIGPWISEVGFEVLYWVPLLRLALRRHGIDPDRVTVITRGGAHCWYRDFAAHGVELFDHVAPDELRELNEQRVAFTGGQKHMTVTDLDVELLRRVGGQLDPEAELVHPSLMYRAFRYFWSWRSPPKVVTRAVDFAPLPRPQRPEVLERLPEQYIAMKAYHSACFPDVPENRAFVRDTVRRVSAHTPVVLLSTGLRVDDHEDVAVAGGGENVFFADELCTPRDNLETQTAIVAGAQALISSYGGFSYLGPFLGVPSVCFWSHRNFNSTHLELMRLAAQALDGPSFVPLDVRHVDVLDGVLGSRARDGVGA